MKLYRFSPSDYLELAAVFNGPHPETGEALVVEDQIPEGVPWTDLPPQPTPFVPDYDPAEIAEVAQRLRVAAGLPDEPTGEVVPASPGGIAGKVKDVVDKVTP